MSKKAIIIFLFLTILIPLPGQKIVPTPADLYKDAVEFMYSEDYKDALFILLNLQENGYRNPNTSYLIGECYLNIQGQKTRSIPYLKEASQKVSLGYKGNTLEEAYAPVKTLLYLGIAYRINNDFDNALHYLNSYLNTIDDVEKDERNLAEFHISRCNNAMEMIQAPSEFSSTTLPDEINTAYSNFNPLVTNDERVIYYMNELKFYDAVMTSVQADAGWQPPENLTPKVKSDGDHLVTGLSADGKQLFFVAYDPYHRGELYTATYINGAWSELEKLNNQINTQFNETHASVSPDGKTLYFTSDRKGGYGGLDIYRSYLTGSGEWGKPVNLGPLINSPYNEESPFLSADGRNLYFSSQGHYNMGGYDVFFSALGEDNHWLPPVNIGYPLNSTDDDLFLFPLGDGHLAYQSRYSAVNGQMDIIRYHIKKIGKPARFFVNGKITLQADSGYDASRVQVAFIDQLTVDTLVVKSLNEDGSFRQKLPAGNYNLDFSEENQKLLTKNLNIPDYFPHNNLVIQEEITVPSRKARRDTFYVKDVRFAFNNCKLDEIYRTYLDEVATILRKYPELVVQTDGYTDALGSTGYNYNLSLMRATAVADYLKEKQILPDRIRIQAKGETNPVALNKNPNGTDNSQGRSYNRRVELIFSGIPVEVILLPINDVPESLRLR
ncbi:MAG: PD40 domain-containing protein [Bacteroidales bacterium]|nr:PD40 domain-containing protein [Bacteroidales bacterium]